MFSLIRNPSHVNMCREKVGWTSFMTLTTLKPIVCDVMATSKSWWCWMHPRHNLWC